MRFPDELKFDVEMAQAVNVAPQNVHDSIVHDAAFRDPVFRQVPLPHTESNLQFRYIYVRQTDLEAFGYTPGCARCEHSMRYGPNRTQIAHSKQCRDRIKD